MMNTQEVNDMRQPTQIKEDIELVQREMAQVLIQQSDLDTRLSQLDRRLRYLENELKVTLDTESV